MNRFRFKLKHLLLAFLFISLCLSAYLLAVRWQRRELLTRIYRNDDVYQLLCGSRSFEVYRVHLEQEAPNLAIDINFPRMTTARCGTVQGKELRRLLDLLSEPQNFVGPFVKDWLFNPTLLLKCKSGDGRVLDIYFCFDMEIAVIMLYAF